MQFQVKLIRQTWENGKKNPSFGPDFGPFAGDLGCLFSFFKDLASIVTRYHGQLSPCKISGKLMIQSWENVVTARPKDGQDWQMDRTTRVMSD